MPSILLIEDETTLAKNIQLFFSTLGYDVDAATTAEEGLAMAKATPPDVVVIDFQLPGMNGLAAIRSLREAQPELRIVMMTGHGSIQLAVDAMKAGAADLLTKPFALADLKGIVQRLIGERRSDESLAYYRRREQERGGLEALLGQSPQIEAVRARIRRVAEAVELAGKEGLPPVLITGETGAGKELVARACHFSSVRADGPFVELNCAAIPANLLEAEIFGAEKGAFTDARERRIGLVEAAEGGTLFLDEIGEMDIGLQAKLLKVLEERRVRRLGASAERRVDVRIVAATNQSLEAQVRAGRFRSDLYFRLRVLQIELPPLRERAGDVALLANQFVAEFGRRYGKPMIALAPAAVRALEAHQWPGNVRELRNVIEQTVLMAGHDVILPEDLSLLPLLPQAGAPETTAPAGGIASTEPHEPRHLADVEREMVEKALQETRWNVTRAAQRLGITRDRMRYRMQKHNLPTPRGS